MRIVSFDKNGSPTLEIHIGDQVVDLSLVAPDLPKDLSRYHRHLDGSDDLAAGRYAGHGNTVRRRSSPKAARLDEGRGYG